MGWRHGGDVQVTDRVGPGPDALHCGSVFEPDQAWQEAEIARVYRQSGRRSTYLGDYHTHPGGRPRPSRRDREVARLIASSPEARIARPIMMIVGLTAAGMVRARAFEWTGRRLRSIRLVIG